MPSSEQPGNPNKALVCHVPPGNPDSAQTIEIGQGAIDAHLGHGDTLGPCPILVARLVEVVVDNPAATVLATWPRDPDWDRHFLVVDRDGALLLASSSSQQNKHAIARLDVLEPNALVVDGIDAGNRPLAFPLLVDSAGYTIVLKKNASQLERVRKLELDLSPATIADLGDQL